MDFNNTKTEIKMWFENLNEIKNANLTFKEEVNFQNIRTLAIDLENKSNMGIVIIYEDSHLFFDFMSKDDSEMKSYNWSEKFNNLENLKERIEESLNKYL
ncbi:hypothetical protein AB9K32_04315 [Allomuricauda sp. XS_ASV26]|uniref:hypothetical protein n=1 Tax=Allomuricauda sp. XS_ASV26 TaxID=3241292 RepID=UPI003510F961